ncbi:MAG TPA: outer membrane beta-barrel protein [Gemmatimonadaceae bacterium]|jgi:opacity protein-like surface antigen|nr:outer membrane beta-barrel protein [Gemmatimonadaceae bacterium]
MKRSLWSVAVAMGLAVSAGAAQAQVPSVKPLSFGVAGGLSVANGDFSNVVNAGYNVSGMVGLHLPAMPLKFRAELQYQHFGLKDQGINITGNWSTLAGIANAIYQLPTPVISPYITGGVGMYHVKGTANDGTNSGSSSENKFGYNLGAGINFHLSSFGTFIEADWQSVSMDGGAMRTIPLRFGVTF